MPGVSEGIHPIFSKYFVRRIRFNQNNPADMVELDKLRDLGYAVEVDQYAPNTLVAVIPTKDTLMEQVTAIYGEGLALLLVQGASDLSLDHMLAFQAMYQRLWADNAVSFTANVTKAIDNDRMQFQAADIAQVLVGYANQIKGATIFPETSMPQAPYTRITKGEYEQAAAQEVGDGVDEDCASGACPIR
jgi:hypothetical protein